MIIKQYTKEDFIFFAKKAFEDDDEEQMYRWLLRAYSGYYFLSAEIDED